MARGVGRMTGGSTGREMDGVERSWRWMEGGGRMEDGWRMENGEWRMENDDGGWRMENDDGGWRMMVEMEEKQMEDVGGQVAQGVPSGFCQGREKKEQTRSSFCIGCGSLHSRPSRPSRAFSCTISALHHLCPPLSPDPLRLYHHGSMEYCTEYRATVARQRYSVPPAATRKKWIHGLPWRSSPYAYRQTMRIPASNAWSYHLQ